MKTIRSFALLLCCTAMFACGEKEKPVPEPANHIDYQLQDTSWEGTYESPVDAPDGSTITFNLTWTMDFLTADSGNLMCEISSEVSQTQYQEINFAYYVEGSTGHFIVDNQEDTFTIDWSNNKISMDLQMPIDIGTGRMLVGGMTDLYRIR